MLLSWTSSYSQISWTASYSKTFSTASYSQVLLLCGSFLTTWDIYNTSSGSWRQGWPNCKVDLIRVYIFMWRLHRPKKKFFCKKKFFISFWQVGRQAAAAVVFKGAIYLLGGESLESRWSIWKNDCYVLFLRSGLSSCEVLNSGAGVWQEAPPMHLGRVGPSC